MDNWITSSTVEGLELRGTILRLERFQVLFEFYQAGFSLRVSEVLQDFRVLLDNAEVYSGRAVVSSFLHTGTTTQCEVKLDEPGVQVSRDGAGNRTSDPLAAYSGFFSRWQKEVKLQPDLKLAVLDLHSYLRNLKLLLEQMALSHPTGNSSQRSDAMREASEKLAPPVLSAIDGLRERFLVAAQRIEPELLPACRAFVQRHLHPHFLCAPFGERTYQKPLGYAGDYEMMNMIHRNTFEGDSWYAKLVHYWLVNQSPARSVRNRVAHMKSRLAAEAARTLCDRPVVRVLNLGCGPAREAQDFITEYPESDHLEMTLVDFDRETLDHAAAALEQARTRSGRATRVLSRQLSVAQLIKDSTLRPRGDTHNLLGQGFDLVYCGGLFDYFNDRMCQQLVGLFYECLAPGGLAVVANMDDRVPFRRMLEFLLDWNLIYRDPQRMARMVPASVPRANWSVLSEPLTVNLFLEVRKPPSA